MGGGHDLYQYGHIQILSSYSVLPQPSIMCHDAIMHCSIKGKFTSISSTYYILVSTLSPYFQVHSVLCGPCRVAQEMASHISGALVAAGLTFPEIRMLLDVDSALVSKRVISI